MEKISNILKNQKTWPENLESSSQAKACEKCGKEIKPVLIPVIEKAMIPACECEYEEYMKQEQEREKRTEQEKYNRLLKNSGLGKKFEGCSFNNWVNRAGTGRAYNQAFKYAVNIQENIKEGRGLIIFGKPGNGKTHLVAAITNKAIQERYTVIFERVPRLLAKLRNTYNGGTVNEGEIVDALIRSDLLILDDAGAEKCSEWTEQSLYTIIDERYTEELATIVTTNSDLEELERKIGPRSMDRLLEMCEIVENRGTSYRQERGGVKDE